MWIGWLALSALANVQAYRVLVIITLPGKSHGILGDGMIRHLLNAGHEVNKNVLDSSVVLLWYNLLFDYK